MKSEWVSYGRGGGYVFQPIFQRQSWKEDNSTPGRGGWGGSVGRQLSTPAKGGWGGSVGRQISTPAKGGWGGSVGRQLSTPAKGGLGWQCRTT